MCFLFMDCLCYMHFPQQNSNVSPQLMMQLGWGRTAEQNLSQVNGLLFCGGRHKQPFWDSCINSFRQPNSVFWHFWTSWLFCYSFLLCCLMVHCAVRERLMYLQTKSSLMVFALAGLCTRVQLWIKLGSLHLDTAFYFNFRAGYKTSQCPCLHNNDWILQPLTVCSQHAF